MLYDTHNKPTSHGPKNLNDMIQLALHFRNKDATRGAELIAGYALHALTEVEKNELDDFVNESDENMELFEQLADFNRLMEMWPLHVCMNRQRSQEGAFANYVEQI